MSDNSLLDNKFTAINTPAAAVTYYLPFLVSGEIDLMAIKNELRNVHKFSAADVSIKAQSLVHEHTKHQKKNPFKYAREFQFGIGLIMIGAGIMFTIFLWKIGFIAALPFAGIVGGLGLVFKALRH